MEILKLFSCFFTIIFIGWNIAYLFLFRKEAVGLAEKYCIAYGLGVAFLSLEALCFYLLKLRLNLLLLLVAWVPLFLANAITLYLQRRAPSDTVYCAPPSAGGSRRFITAFLLCGISLEAAYALFRALIKPLESYDAVAIYGIKAKIFYLAGAIPADFFTGLGRLFPHPDYPLNIPLAEALVYIFLGNMNDQLVKILFPLYFFGILGGLYAAIRRFSSRPYALLFTFLLATIPQFSAYSTNGYLDLPLAYYLFFSFLFLFRWIEAPEKTGFLIMSAMMTGLAAWTKNEGLMYFAVSVLVMAAFFALEHKKMPLLKAAGSLALYVSIAGLIYFPWQIVKGLAHLSNSDVNLAAVGPLGAVRELHKLGPIIYEFQKHLFGPKKWNIIWFVFLFAAVTNFKKLFSRAQRYISIFLLLTVSGYIFFYMVSHVEINYFLSRTWSRFLLHFLPIVVYWLALILRDDVAL